MDFYHPTQGMRVEYGRSLVVVKDWPRWFAYTLVKLLRRKADKVATTADLLRIAGSPPSDARRTQWWDYVDNAWLGYLEAKYDGSVSLTSLASIEVPAERLAEVEGWNLPNELHALIKARPTTTPVATKDP